MNALIDADIVAWRAAASAEDDDIFIATSRADFILNTMLDELDVKEQVLFLTGKNNFRYQIYPEYKAFRANKPRPKWEQAVKQHLVDHWQALYIDGMEADDALGIAQCAAPKDSTIICTIDKDLKMIPGNHYNFVNKRSFYVTDEEGIRFFYYQLLIGDPTDAIKGVYGIGPKKAEKLLAGKGIEELYGIVSDQYSCEEEMDLNAQCLWIWRKQDDNWRNHVIS